jgi:YidC/Oxa1 family membrane protein insertase
MQNLHAGESSFGMVYLGVDTLSPGGEGVKHWGGKLAALFKAELAEQDLPKLPVEVDRAPDARAVDWVAVKNKYFAQILVPAEGGEGFSIHARREVTPRELRDPDFVPKLGAIEDVAATVNLAATVLQPGQAITNQLQYFIGPKKYDDLAVLGLHQVGVMELGDWIRPIATLLLKTLNLIHEHVWPHNYGVAIMLLTIIIRIIFWPITHKSTESMKRMAEVQPLVTEIRAKYKDNPQKMQQEIMALYKAHKINPLGGCLPMLIQIPVFFALFVVLRSAIELRFASFLWIQDLSEPENLLAGVLPLPLNILPILMAATMYWQQKLMPTAGDPAQAKMMRILMPGMMLVFLYNFASGLALYWTTQNILMIVQQLLTLRKQKLKALAAKAQSPGK